MDEARAAEVYDLDFASRVGLDQNVFWFQIAMNQSQAVNEF